MYTILAVDDEPDNLEMVEYALENEFDVVPVRSGEMALRYLKENTPDLILLDIKMPKMDGFEVYSKIKEDKKYEDIPVIFLTALNDVDTEDKSFQMGAVDFINKPFEPKIILRRVKRTLELVNKTKSVSVVTNVNTDESSQLPQPSATLSINVKGMDIRLYQKDIYYIEVFGNICIVRTANRELSVRETLGHMEERLVGDFVKVGKSYIVNIRFITEIEDDVIVMTSGKRIKIPRRIKKDIIQEILKKTNNSLLN